MTQTIRLGDLLVRAGVIAEGQLNAALAEQKKWGGRLGTILVRMGALSEDLLVKALSKQLGIPRANLDAASVPPQILERIDRATCDKYNVVPLSYVADRRALMMGVSDPFHVVAMDDLSRRVGLRIEPYLAGETAITQAIARMFGGVKQLDHASTIEEDPMKFVGNDGHALVQGRAQAEADQRALQATRAASRQTIAPMATSTVPQPSGSVLPQSTTQSFVAPALGAQTMPPQPASSGLPSSSSSSSSLPGPAGSTAEGLDELDRLAKRQAKALRAVLELLIEKGVLTREEYLAYVNAR